jgi:hypothetical protein
LERADQLAVLGVDASHRSFGLDRFGGPTISRVAMPVLFTRDGESRLLHHLPTNAPQALLLPEQSPPTKEMLFHEA